MSKMSLVIRHPSVWKQRKMEGTLVVDVTSELITQKLWKKTVWTLNVVGFIGALHCGKCRIEHSLELDLIPGTKS